ncbi:DUF6031 family protein [Streptomyces sp. NPDC047072]|uniref:DUF6031 family protein n=1 Tax=Streptomyces sp. NPDC047072 TaxID=3154809 RepID=UPI00340D063C
MQPALFPGVRAGRGLPPETAVRAWATAAWLMQVDGRAYVEDLDGGAEQPQLRQVVKLRLLELLAEIDIRLTGAEPAGEGHLLALALEYGLHEVCTATGPELAQLFDLDQEFGGDLADDAGVRELWNALCEAFPGQIPDPLVASGQGEVLRALRDWSKLCTAAGTDAAFLEPFLKDA